MAKQHETKEPLNQKGEIKEARFIRFPSTLEEWMVEKSKKDGFKNVNQFVIDLVRKERQQDQAMQ